MDERSEDRRTSCGIEVDVVGDDIGVVVAKFHHRDGEVARGGSGDLATDFYRAGEDNDSLAWRLLLLHRTSAQIREHKVLDPCFVEEYVLCFRIVIN